MTLGVTRWPTTRLKHVLRAPLAYGVLVPDKYDGDDAVRLVRITDVSQGRVAESGLERISPALDADYLRTRLKAGDLVVSVVGTLGESFITPQSLEGANLSRALARVQLRQSDIDVRFARYWIQSASFSEQVDEIAHGSAQKVLNLSSLGDFVLPLPTLPQQRAIATFLDRKTAAVDALIEAKEHLVTAAEERRLALTSDTVLGALSSAKRRHTVTPLGALPEQWTAKRLMHLTAPGRPIMYGIVLPGPNVDDGVPIIKSGNCTRETLRPHLLHKTTFDIEAGYVRSRVAKNDIVYAIRGSVGMAALVPEDVAGANLTQDAARIAPAPDVNPRWLLYAIQSAPVWAQLAAGIVGATVKGINIRDLKRPFVPVPPRHEQDEIAAYLDAEIGKLHELEAATSHSIERLREYRQALVTAAVTGQLDIAAQEAA